MAVPIPPGDVHEHLVPIDLDSDRDHPLPGVEALESLVRPVKSDAGRIPGKHHLMVVSLARTKILRTENVSQQKQK